MSCFSQGIGPFDEVPTTLQLVPPGGRAILHTSRWRAAPGTCAVWNNAATAGAAIVERACCVLFMHPVKTFHVRPAVPERLKALEKLAYNLRWSWDHETINLFRRLDRPLWEASGHN